MPVGCGPCGKGACIFRPKHIIAQQISNILDECRTLWGEPERVQLSNVHGAVACACVPRPTWNRCMCMTVSACHPNVIAQLKDTSHQKL